MAVPMAVGYFGRMRMMRKRQLLDLIRQHAPIEEDKLCGVFSLKTGLTFKKIRQYLEELEATGLIVRENGVVTTPEKLEEKEDVEG